MTSDLRLIETACIPCLYKPVLGTELGKSSSAAFNSQTTLPKLVFTDCWDLANPNTSCAVRARHVPVLKLLSTVTFSEARVYGISLNVSFALITVVTD
jgi:hypothetical protein